MENTCHACKASLACVAGVALYFYPKPGEMIVYMDMENGPIGVLVGVGGCSKRVFVHFKTEEEVRRCPKTMRETGGLLRITMPA